ncbi:MAG TPA: prolyl oligopeptidase family serine peptidase [Terracidiphilus sp.]|jgi:dipeptidyl aminopeptidase/acylaminoacyl peptidase|nr:prolyl oligopeptidase family serine peptidase [Terracidiphilus sp.]
MLSSLHRSCLAFIFCVSGLAFAAGILRAEQAPAPHFPTTEDLRHLKSIGGPQLSPDGKQALFTVVDATADGAKAHVWLVATTGSDKARQLTFSPPADKRGERNPQWAPDGSAILFLAHRGERTELFRLDLRGGEAAPYNLKIVPPVDESKEKDAIPPPGAEKSNDKKPKERPDPQKNGAPEQIALEPSGFAISADGKWLAVWARDPQTPGEKKQSDAKADASWVNHEKHGARLYLAALKADGALDGALKTLAIAPDVRGAVWSPASDRLLVFTEAPNDLSDLGPAGAAWVADAAAPDKPAKLDAVPPTVGGGEWRTDGSAIVFSAATPENAPPGYDELFALALGDASAKPVRLSAGFAGQLNASALFFAQDGSVVTPAAVGTRAAVVRVGMDGKTAPTPIDLGAPVVSGLNTNRKQTGWLWLAESGAQSQKLCFAQQLGNPCTALPIPELAPAALRSVEPQLVQWMSDGLTIEGLLYLPPDAGSKKVPLIVDVHGGPFGAFENRNDPFAAFLVGHGWAVLRPNPRGSSNYGVKFAAANKNDLGGGDYRDVMAGVDAVLAKYPLDPSKMALMGYSYGGEMAAFVEGKTDRFKAIISGAPVIDQFSEYGTEHGSWYDRWYFGKPWEHLEDAWRQSPLAGAAKAKTPFLLLQGQSDSTDPLGQSEEMYRALRQEGVPVELVSYPREDHGPLAGGMFGRPSPEPWHGYDARQRVAEFIEKAFGNGASPAESTTRSSTTR